MSPPEPGILSQDEIRRIAALTDLGRVMSNYDHTIEPWADERLRAGGCRGDHTAWDFFGIVWYADGQFHEAVMVHQVLKAVIVAPTLPALAALVSNQFGWD